MSYNILGINLSHNSSVCVLSDGNLDFFLEEERLSKIKHDDFPLHLLHYISQHFQINEIYISGLSGFYLSPYYIKSLDFTLTNLFPNISVHKRFLKQHHLTHTASSFYNSGFKKALSVVIDGGGDWNDINKKENFNGYETETIQVIEYPLKLQEIYKSYITDGLDKTNKKEKFSPLVSLTKVYEGVSEYLGFSWSEAGKTMGLSSYGKQTYNDLDLYLGDKGNPDIIYNDNLKGKLKLNPIKKEWHKNPFKITDFEKDLAFQVQQESQKAVGDLIEKAIQKTGLKQVCCAGGYFLNCVANYYLIKRFPNIKFYFEPISSDAGNAIGVAKLAWHEKTQDTTIRPQKTLYYGPKYSKEDLLKGIQKYLA
jgi:carbamoyltransferase